MLRVAGIFGPMYHSMANLPSRLCQAAAHGRAPDFSGHALRSAESRRRQRRVLRQGRGRWHPHGAPDAEACSTASTTSATAASTRNADLVEAIREVVPEFEAELPAGRRCREPLHGPVSRTTSRDGLQAQYRRRARPGRVRELAQDPRQLTHEFFWDVESLRTFSPGLLALDLASPTPPTRRQTPAFARSTAHPARPSAQAGTWAAGPPGYLRRGSRASSPGEKVRRLSTS